MGIDIKVEVKSGSKASQVGESYCYDGVDWSHPCDRCYSDGNGVVFLNCDDRETADFVMAELEKDERIASYEAEENDERIASWEAEEEEEEEEEL